MEHSFAYGNYTVIYEGGGLKALRYGEPWQDLTDNNLVYWMLVEVDRLKAEREELLLSLSLIEHATAPNPNDGGGHQNAYELATAARTKALGSIA